MEEQTKARPKKSFLCIPSDADSALFCAPLGNDKIVLFDKNAVSDERDVVLPRKETGRYSEGELE